ncbi:unnamed protein product, partial [Staurois parvus]
MYTAHQGTDDQCALMISVALAVPPVSVHQCLCVSAHQYHTRASAHQCHINATYQCIPEHINATYQCPSELPFSVTHQCQFAPTLSMPISAANHCHLSVSQCP